MDEAFGCKQCGYCCIYLTGIIVALDADKKLQYYAKPNDVVCPHLETDGAKTRCRIHDEPYFQESPCHRHNNPDYDPDIWHWGSSWRCIGPGLMAQGLRERRPPQVVTLAELEKFGD